MREHKFRAWNPQTKVMGDCATLEEIIEIVYDKPEGANRISVIWLEFTGLLDKNNTGRETYHKDIMRVYDGFSGDHFEKGGNFLIEWIDDGWAIVDKNGEYFCSLFEAIYNRGAEVIGNIHENPELLEKT